MLKIKNSFSKTFFFSYLYFSFFVYLSLYSYLLQFLNALSNIMDSSIAISD